MFGAVIPLCLLLAPWTTNAIKLIKVPISTRLGPKVPSSSLGLKGRTEPQANASLQNRVLEITATVQTGNNQTFDRVLVDTGSSLLWVGKQERFQPGPNTETINQTFSVGYGTGSASGLAYRDEVTIGSATVNSQIIGAANSTTGFNDTGPIDGILGLGTAGGNNGDVSGFNTTLTFVESLKSEGTIDHAIFGLYFPSIGEDGMAQGTGEISFGGVDESRISGEVTWVKENLDMDDPNFAQRSINVTGFSFGNVSLQSVTPAFTDSGNQFLGIAFDQFFEMLQTYGQFDQSLGLTANTLVFNSTDSDSLPPLSFTFGDASFTIPPAQYLIPKELYPLLNITYGVDLPHSWIFAGGQGTFRLSQPFLQAVYSAYDMDNRMVGFAKLA